MSTCQVNSFHLGVLQKASCSGNVCQEGIVRCEWLHELAMHKHATDLERLCGSPTCKTLNGLIRGLSIANTWVLSIFLIFQTSDSACTSLGTCDRIHKLLTCRGLGWRNFDLHRPSRLWNQLHQWNHQRTIRSSLATHLSLLIFEAKYAYHLTKDWDNRWFSKQSHLVNSCPPHFLL